MTLQVDITGYYKITWPCGDIDSVTDRDIFGNHSTVLNNRSFALTAGSEIEPCEICGTEATIERVDGPVDTPVSLC